MEPRAQRLDRPCLAAVLAVLAASCASPGVGRTAADEHVDELLRAMRDGSWEESHDASFTGLALGWEHVGPLMRHAGSATPLRRFPVNRMSSDAPPAACTEGVMALWLVEAIRVASRWGYPSAAPVLDATDPSASDSVRHERALAAYRRWWSQHGGDESAARAIDPLVGSGVVWR